MKRPVINAPIERARSMAKPHHAIITFGNFLISDSFLPPGQTRAGEFMREKGTTTLLAAPTRHRQLTNNLPFPVHTHTYTSLSFTLVAARLPSSPPSRPSQLPRSIDPSFRHRKCLSSCCTLDRPSSSRSTLHSFGSVNAFLSRFLRSFVAHRALLSLKTHHFNPLLFLFS